jgi:hypothetical protein
MADLNSLDWGKGYSPIRSAEDDDIILPEDGSEEDMLSSGETEEPSFDNGFTTNPEDIPEDADESEVEESEKKPGTVPKFDPETLKGSFACHCPSCQGDYLRVGGTPIKSKFPGPCPLCQADVEQIVAGVVTPLEEQESAPSDILSITSSIKGDYSATEELVLDDLYDAGIAVDYVDIQSSATGVQVGISLNNKEYQFSFEDDSPKNLVQSIRSSLKRRIR